MVNLNEEMLQALTEKMSSFQRRCYVLISIWIDRSRRVK